MTQKLEAEKELVLSLHREFPLHRADIAAHMFRPVSHPSNAAKAATLVYPSSPLQDQRTDPDQTAIYPRKLQRAREKQASLFPDFIPHETEVIASPRHEPTRQGVLADEEDPATHLNKPEGAEETIWSVYRSYQDLKLAINFLCLFEFGVSSPSALSVRVVNRFAAARNILCEVQMYNGLLPTSVAVRLPSSLDPREMARNPRRGAALLFLEKHTDIKAPRLHLCHSFKENNPIRWPHMVTDYLQGESYDKHRAWRTEYRGVSPDADQVLGYLAREEHAQDLAVASALGGLYRSMLATTSTSPGTIGCDDLAAPELLRCYEVSGSQTEPYQSAPSTQSQGLSIPQFFEDRLGDIMRHYLSNADVRNFCRDTGFRFELLGELGGMCGDLDHNGWFDNIQYTLYHPGILAKHVILDDSDEVTGYVGWNGAGFAPAFVTCRPPSWLWADGDAECEGHLKEGDEGLPEDARMRELKERFEDAAGPLYTLYARTPQYRFGRKLFWATRGLPRSKKEVSMIEDMVKDWRAVRELLIFPDY